MENVTQNPQGVPAVQNGEAAQTAPQVSPQVPPQQQTPVPAQTAQVPPQAQPQPTPAPAPGNPPQNTAPEIPESIVSQEDQNRYGEELARDGKLSDASYAELAKKGLSRDLVDQFIQGQQAASERFFGEVYEFVGGKARYDEMMRWASANLSEEEKASYNEMLGSNKTTTIKAGLTALFNAFEKASPTPPAAQLSGTGSAAGAVGGSDIYTSREEMAADMGKDDYWKNPAEQRRVAEKISRSVAAGIKL